MRGGGKGRFDCNNHLVQHNKQYHMKVHVLLYSFHLNGHTLGVHPQTPNLEPAYKQYHMKVLFNIFHLNGHTLGFDLNP